MIRQIWMEAERKIRVFGQAKMVICQNKGMYSRSCCRAIISAQRLARNELMSAQTALKTDQSVHCSDTRPTMLLFLFAVTIGTAAVRGNLGAIHTAPLKRMLNATRERIILK